MFSVTIIAVTLLDLTDKTTWQSSTHDTNTHNESWFAASRAIDGKSGSAFDSNWHCSLTRIDTDSLAWWALDMEHVYTVYKITIIPRTSYTYANYG